MPRVIVTEPPTTLDAFQGSDERCIQTQAASLLAIGLQLSDRASLLPTEDLDVLELPSAPPLKARIKSENRKEVLQRRFGTSIASKLPVGEDVTWSPEIFSMLAAEHVRKPTDLSAVDLMEACLRHPHELVRAAAATAYHEWSSEPERLARILEQETYSADLLTRQLAAIGLAQVSPGHRRLTDFQQTSGRTRSAGTGNTAMIVHGTAALGATWWQPQGDFHSYLLSSIRSDLYASADRFAWTGGYTRADRARAAVDLLRWVESHNEQGLDLFAHSHGGSVAMLASQQGVRLGKLILLACPVHADMYYPDFTQVKEVISIRVRFDIIILADRGGQRFKDSRIKENILPIWFDHGATHKPDVWKNSTYKIPSMV
jgi:pimeloyl-ACP methyl ester carboxylesterase